MTFDHQRDSAVKCVVVGDTGVGKTRLICARACGTTYTLDQLMKTHMSTVWAIDQYRSNTEVLNRSWCSVDGVTVPLHLWDTFGYHDKNRHFAYGRADVVLICFSLVRPKTLEHVRSVWIKEVEKFCPKVPIILCGCQADLRYLCLDQEFINMDKGPFFREIRDEDIITPNSGRLVAKEIGAVYYETSVRDNFGIDDVFQNVVRGGMTRRRGLYFWDTLFTLKRVNQLQSQKPFLPPKPKYLRVTIMESRFRQDMKDLLSSHTCSDVIFVTQGVNIQAHTICLTAASPVFRSLFESLNLGKCKNRSDASTENLNNKERSKLCNNDTHDSNIASKKDNGACYLNNGAYYDDDDAYIYNSNTCLLQDDQHETAALRRNISQISNPDVIVADKFITSNITDSNLPMLQCFPPILSVEQKECENSDNSYSNIWCITLSDQVSPNSLQLILHFLYTADSCELFHRQDRVQLMKTKEAAELFGFLDVVKMIENSLRGEEFMNVDIEAKFQEQYRHQMAVLVGDTDFTDIEFEVDNGVVSAHKALIMARCDVLFNMFTDGFRERDAKMVCFPGVSCEVFQALLYYLYTDQCPPVTNIDHLDLLALADRLCLPRLVHLVEDCITSDLHASEESGINIMEHVVSLLEPAQFFSAHQISSWCLTYLSIHYKQLHSKYSKILRHLQPENQIFLSRHRWPPLWYLKEVDYYEKTLIDKEREMKSTQLLRRSNSRGSGHGCLSFCRTTPPKKSSPYMNIAS